MHALGDWLSVRVLVLCGGAWWSVCDRCVSVCVGVYPRSPDFGAESAESAESYRICQNLGSWGGVVVVRSRSMSPRF